MKIDFHLNQPAAAALVRAFVFHYTVKIISDTHNPYGMASNFLLGSQIRIRVEFRLLIKQ